MSVPDLPTLRRTTTSSQLEVEIEDLDLTALLRIGLHPSALPCGRCGGRPGHHRATTDCAAYVRPDLPPGYAYADQLRAGSEFRFLPTTGADCLRRVTTASCCVVDELTVLTSVAADCAPATHWVQGSLVVAAEPQPEVRAGVPAFALSVSATRRAASRGPR